MIAVRPRFTVDTRRPGIAEPLVEVIRAVRRLGPGEAVEILIADRRARSEVPRWAEKAGHRVALVEQLEGGERLVIEKRS